MHVVMAMGRRRTNAMMNRWCISSCGCVKEEGKVKFKGRKLREEVAGLKRCH